MALIALLTTALIAALAISSMTSSAIARDKNCSDFGSQKAAQHWFHKHNPHKDPAGLDADNDGRACEDNPCPCTNKKWKAAPDNVAASRPQVLALRVA
jgi:Excalibur calcium-binding domain